MSNAFRFMLVALVLWGQPLCSAQQPQSLAEAMQERSALANAMTNQFTTPGGEASAEGSQTQMMVLAAALVCGVVVFRLLTPFVGGYLRRRSALGKVSATKSADADPEEQLISEFVASFATAPSATTGLGASEANGSPSQVLSAAEPPKPVRPSDPIGEFLTSAQNDLAAMRKLISTVGQDDDEVRRDQLLRELLNHTRLLRGNSCLPGVLPVWQMASALEGLLRQLTGKPDNVNSSTLRTLASAVDLLHSLCVRGLDPNLAKDPPVRLLAVDDDAISRHLIEVALKKALTQPDLAADGEGALRLAETQPYDVIFLDVEMPGMNGFELCSRIHGTSANQTTPVVFVTRFSDLDARAKSCLAGGEDLLGKPFLIFEIAVKALTLVLRRRLQLQAARNSLRPDIESAFGLPAPAKPVSSPRPSPVLAAAQ
jgi:CheY-like chemotaxis protein